MRLSVFSMNLEDRLDLENQNREMGRLGQMEADFESARAGGHPLPYHQIKSEYGEEKADFWLECQKVSETAKEAHDRYVLSNLLENVGEKGLSGYFEKLYAEKGHPSEW